jgi:hypothetical protein
MADNVELNAGSGGATIATDEEVGVAQHQLVKVEWGVDGTFTKVAAGAAALPIQDGGNTITVDGTVAVTNAGLTELAAAIDTEVQVDVVGALPAGNNNIGDVDIASIAAGDNNIGNVDIASIAAGDNNIGNVDVVTLPGSAHDAAVSGNPVRIGAYASASAPTDVSAGGDTVNIWADLAGRVQVGDGGATLSVDDGGGNLSIDDGGNSITVDGTVSVTGVATAANQTTLIGHVDGIEGLLTTIDADTGNIATSVAAIDNAAATIGTTDVLRVAIFDNSNNQITSFGGSGGTSAADDADFTAGTTLGTPAMGIYESTPTSVTDGDLGTVGITQGRRLKTSSTIDAALPAGTNNIGDVDILSIAAGNNNIGDVDIASIAAGDNNIGNVDIVTVPAPLSTTGGGTEAAALRVTIATDSTGVLSVDDNGGSLTVDGTVTANLAAGTNNIGDVDVLSVVPGTGATSLGKAEDAAHSSGDTGVMALGVRAASPTERSAGPTDGDYEPFATNEVGAVWTTPTASANGGLTIFRSLDLDESEEEVKASAGTVYGAWVTNTATATRWLKFYNATAANVTVGTTTPVITIGIPGNTSDDISANFGFGMGIGFGTAITVAATTGVADNDTGAPAANDVIVNIFYK